MQIVDTVICSAKLKFDHPELFHYTGRFGFEAIIRSNQLWATHFRHLSDDAEVAALKPLLIRAAAAIFDREVKSRDRGTRNLYFQRGGGVAHAKRFTESLYAATFERNDTRFAVDAYTASFSTHSADTPYERENGLETQWRFYAANGFCLVFDTNGLSDRLAAEFDRFDFTHLNLEEVRYITDGIPLRGYFDFIEPALHVAVDQYFTGYERPEMATMEFLRCATLLKRAVFREEREVRIVAIPGAPGYQEQAVREYPKLFVKKSIPSIQEMPKRHITLFDGVEIKLPIKRVIVGPSESQNENADFARSIIDCEVTLSRPRHVWVRRSNAWT